jgi:hypothetical protein
VFTAVIVGIFTAHRNRDFLSTLVWIPPVLDAPMMESDSQCPNVVLVFTPSGRWERETRHKILLE